MRAHLWVCRFPTPPSSIRRCGRPSIAQAVVARSSYSQPIERTSYYCSATSYTEGLRAWIVRATSFCRAIEHHRGRTPIAPRDTLDCVNSSRTTKKDKADLFAFFVLYPSLPLYLFLSLSWSETPHLFSNHHANHTGRCNRRHPLRNAVRPARRDRPRAVVPRRRYGRAPSPPTRAPSAVSPPRARPPRRVSKNELVGAVAVPPAKKMDAAASAFSTAVVRLRRERSEGPGGARGYEAERRELDGGAAAVGRQRTRGRRYFVGFGVRSGRLQLLIRLVECAKVWRWWASTRSVPNISGTNSRSRGRA